MTTAGRVLADTIVGIEVPMIVAGVLVTVIGVPMIVAVKTLPLAVKAGEKKSRGGSLSGHPL